MYVNKTNSPAFVTLPDGRKLTRSDLPSVETIRWVASRKARVVLAVSAGLITKGEACKLYNLSEEELDSWRFAIKSHGISALKVTKLKKYRQP